MPIPELIFCFFMIWEKSSLMKVAEKTFSQFLSVTEGWLAAASNVKGLLTTIALVAGLPTVRVFCTHIVGIVPTVCFLCNSSERLAPHNECASNTHIVGSIPTVCLLCYLRDRHVSAAACSKDCKQKRKVKLIQMAFWRLYMWNTDALVLQDVVPAS